MSREVRRVPLDWRHPTEPNPYWLSQEWWRQRNGRPTSRLHGSDLRFVGLIDDFPGAKARHAADLAEITRREGHGWAWPLGYYLTGYTDPDGRCHEPRPWGGSVLVRGEDHMQRLLIEQHSGESPDPADYMPVFPAADAWCLYETVSEGTPVTPVFATARELVQHLVAIGEDHDQKPYRREAAERLVQSGSSLGSFVVAGGVLFDAARDADVLDRALAERAEGET